MLTCPRHTVVVLEQTLAGPLCFLCGKVVEPIEVEDPESKLLGLRPRAKPEQPDDAPGSPGRYDQAIRKYKQAAKDDPKDPRIPQKLGELHQKKGDNKQAAAYFLQVAESYERDGFALRAVAVLKQVLKLDPDRVDVQLRLAGLYVQLGLEKDATTRYGLAADWLEKGMDPRPLVAVLKQMVNLDPRDVALRTRLGEALCRMEQATEGLAQFRAAIEQLCNEGKLDPCLPLVERAAWLAEMHGLLEAGIALLEQFERACLERGNTVGQARAGLLLARLRG